MNQRPRTPSTITRKLCSLLLCGLVAAVPVQRTEAGEAHAHRFNGFRNAQFEARNARQAERMQQRAQERAARREAVVPGPPLSIAPPAYQAPDVPAQEHANRPGRMTPDERRALRQQINEAGRDVYRPNRP